MEQDSFYTVLGYLGSNRITCSKHHSDDMLMQKHISLLKGENGFQVCKASNLLLSWAFKQRDVGRGEGQKKAQQMFSATKG